MHMYMHTYVHTLLRKRREPPPFATRMDLEGIMPRERSQIET